MDDVQRKRSILLVVGILCIAYVLLLDPIPIVLDDVIAGIVGFKALKSRSELR